MSDIHGNLPALEAARESLPVHDQVVVAGDLCLEGPCPAEVFDRLREWKWTLLMGNTDRDTVNPPAQAKRKKTAQIAWARSQLGPERLTALGALSFSARVGDGKGHDALVVHANPLNLDDQLDPTMTEEELAPYLAAVDAEVLAFGHLHIPYVRPVGNVLLMDVASVGHPKDCDRRAAFTVLEWDDGVRSVTQVRVPYDLQRTIDLMMEREMPGQEKEAADLLRASY